MLADLDESLVRIQAALHSAGSDGLARALPQGGEEAALGEALASLHWHETYHTGQFELLRQLAGKNDAVIS